MHEFGPDLILCDIMMPELDGFGVLAALREDECTEVIPMAFLTALGERENLRRAMQARWFLCSHSLRTSMCLNLICYAYLKFNPIIFRKKPGMRALVLLVVLAVPLPAHAAIDFCSNSAMQTTCAQARKQKPEQLCEENEKVAYVICSGVDVVTDTWRWTIRQLPTLQLDSRNFRQQVRDKLELILGKLKTARQLLETVRTTKPLFVIHPGEWVLDLNGDGTITPFEKHFFWVARRGNDQIAAFSGINSPASYYEKNFVRPVVKLDQSDVYWAVAYLNFAEAALNIVLSYDFDPARKDRIYLLDANRIKNIAFPRLLEGIAVSRKLRQSLLGETDNDLEWIANPKQANSSFPLILDAGAFVTWGALLDHMDKLVRGKTLLGGSAKGSRPEAIPSWRCVDLTWGTCKPGEGLNIGTLLVQPLSHPGNAQELAARCVKPTKAVPLSGLANLLEESLKRNARASRSATAEWTVIRHLYWVN